VGFEPTLEFPLNTLSKRAPSATRPSLRRAPLEGTTLKEACDRARYFWKPKRDQLFNSIGKVGTSQPSKGTFGD
jgi:hypothetical protein